MVIALQHSALMFDGCWHILTRYAARCDMKAVAEMFKIDSGVDAATAVDMVVTKLAVKQPL